MRSDLDRLLKAQGIDSVRLSTIQRILLTTEGTVTDIVEAYLGELMQVVKLHQEEVRAPEAMPVMAIEGGEKILNRKILLRGEKSQVNFIYAESVIVPDRLAEPVREGLLNSNRPIGQLMFEYETETFREILSCGCETAGILAPYFKCAKTQPIIFRTYRVLSQGRPVMLITEKFCEELFLRAKDTNSQFLNESVITK